jgi:hypothetical protein
MRVSNRRCCSFLRASNPILNENDPSLHDVLLYYGTKIQKPAMLFFSANPITYSTPARLYQLLSKTTISPAAGKYI